jgi:hypothetical protein
MPADLDQFLVDLRGQLEHCAREETAESLGLGVRLLRRRALVAAAATLVTALVAVLLAVLFVRSSQLPAPIASTVDRHGTAAFVQPPRAAVTGSPTKSFSLGAPLGYFLTGVAAHTAVDAWATGYLAVRNDTLPSGAENHPLLLHWDGTTWREMAAPDGMGIYALAVAPDGSVWALANRKLNTVQNTSVQQILRWDGRQWSSLPTGLTGKATLGGIAAMSRTDVWAVGELDQRPLIIHWDGNSWSTVDLPPGAGALRSVSGSGPDDVWAAGIADSDSGRGLILHWDGVRWSSVTVPDFRSETGLLSISALSSSAAWACGDSIVLSWDGRAWQKVEDKVAREGSDLGATQAQAVSLNDVWFNGMGTFVQHWDGEDLQRVDILSGLAIESERDRVTIGSLAARTPDDVWAAGSLRPASVSTELSMPLILHWNGSEWRVVVDSVKPL